MRRVLCAFLILLSVGLVMSTGANAATMTIAEEHISIDVPSGWTAERNYTSGGLVYDLYMEGPASSSGLIAPVVMLDGTSWPGSVTSATLYAEMEREMEDLEDDPDVTSVVIVSAPANTTHSGQKANDCTVRMEIYGVSVTVRLIIMANGDWDRCWEMLFMDETADWTSLQPTFTSVLSSLTVEEKDGSDASTLLMIGIVVAIVVVIAVAVLLMRRKKQPTAVPMPPVGQPVQQSPPPQPPPSSP